jgi:hypothetical protein
LSPIMSLRSKPLGSLDPATILLHLLQRGAAR